MDDRGPGRERRELARHAVVEPRADRDENVARVHREVRPLRPVHARPAEMQLVRLRERALAHQRRHDRERPGLGEPRELGAGVAVERPAADVEHRLAGVRDRARRLADLQRVDLRRRPPAREIDVVGVGEVERRLLQVARHVDEHRPAAARSRDVERRLHRGRDVADVGDEPRVLDHRHRDPGDVALLEGVGADQVRPHLARDADERRRVHPRVGDRRDEVCRARPRRGDRHSRPARRARVPLRHVPRALLVAGEDVPHGGARGPSRRTSA